MDSGLGGSRLGKLVIGRAVSSILDIPRRPLTRLRAHPSLGCRVEGLIEAWGHDISVARHADVIWSRMRTAEQWAAVNYTALPRAHLGALFSLRFGTAPLARNVDHDMLITSRLCQYCAVRGRAFIEDEAHLCLDCPAYEDLRMDWARVVSVLKPRFRPLAADESVVA